MLRRLGSSSIALNKWQADRCVRLRSHGRDTRLFDRSCFADLLQLKGNSGAKGMIFSRPHDVAPFDFPAAAIDIDTPADYQRFLSQDETGLFPAEQFVKRTGVDDL